MTSLDRDQLAALIDHTLLKPEATAADVTALLREAEELGTYSICVSPSMLPVETSVKVATVCGFPSGQHSLEVKAFEARESADKGADEVDMVLNVGLARAGEYEAVEHEIRAVRDVAKSPVVLKVIIESAALSDEQIVGVCEAAEAMVAAGASRLGLSSSGAILAGGTGTGY
ncbi:MAG: deoxyribose-phosphate aldolase, partial [Brachybacterium sp.]|nr:deoxyribose-phosphate aldolase [Brachybacterium sp.]